MSLAPDQMICPNCGEIAVSDSVDIGVGIQVRGNFYCEACHWAKPTDEQPFDFDLFLEDPTP